MQYLLLSFFLPRSVFELDEVKKSEQEVFVHFYSHGLQQYSCVFNKDNTVGYTSHKLKSPNRDYYLH